MNGHTNMTSNIAGVWDKAGAPLREWSGKTGLHVLPELQAAINELSRDMLPYERKGGKSTRRWFGVVDRGGPLSTPLNF